MALTYEYLVKSYFVFIFFLFRFDVGANGNMTARMAMDGEFQRTISLFRTSYSFVAVGRDNKPDVLSMLWFSQVNLFFYLDFFFEKL